MLKTAKTVDRATSDEQSLGSTLTLTSAISKIVNFAILLTLLFLCAYKLQFRTFIYYPRDALHSAVFAVERRLSVCLSVCLSVSLPLFTWRYGIVSKRLNLFKTFWTVWYHHHSVFF